MPGSKYSGRRGFLLGGLADPSSSSSALKMDLSRWRGENTAPENEWDWGVDGLVVPAGKVVEFLVFFLSDMIKIILKGN